MGSPWDLGFQISEDSVVLDRVISIQKDETWSKLSMLKKGGLCMAPFDTADDLRLAYIFS